MGRKRGSINFTTRQLRESVSLFISDKWDELDEVWVKLSPKEKSRLFTGLLSYVMPKPTSDFTDAEREKLFKILENEKVK
jgi:hypothetical protein